MRRTTASPDPLLLLILASAGLVGAEACGGESVGTRDGSGVGGIAGDTTVGGTGGTGGTTGGAGGSDGGTAAVPPVTEGVVGCANPSFPYGEDAGLVFCNNGFFHRESAGVCPQTPVRSSVATGSAPCQSDADCASLENGRCMPNGFLQASCVSSCETDADCGDGFVCYCGTIANLCVAATCTEDADCGDGLLCASYIHPTGVCSADTGFACQSPDDECTAQCPIGASCFVSDVDDTITRQCVDNGAGGTCGRPFLVLGTERLAAATTRSDWCDEAQAIPELAELTATERLALATHWQAAARMEHASIAAFARFALELLALGAPAALMEQTTSALADEQRHATTCFALASAFAGAPTGPAALPVGGCLAAVDLESVTLTTFLEGCIGETIAAVEARELALTATDAVLRATLAGIAEDEARHALLAWGFLKWALELGGPSLLARINDAWDTEAERRVEHPSSTLGLTPERALALGLPSAEFRRDVRRRVLEEIVRPCLDAFERGTEPEDQRAAGRTTNAAARSTMRAAGPALAGSVFHTGSSAAAVKLT